MQKRKGDHVNQQIVVLYCCFVLLFCIVVLLSSMLSSFKNWQFFFLILAKFRQISSNFENFVKFRQMFRISQNFVFLGRFRQMTKKVPGITYYVHYNQGYNLL